MAQKTFSFETEETVIERMELACKEWEWMLKQLLIYLQ